MPVVGEGPYPQGWEWPRAVHTAAHPQPPDELVKPAAQLLRLEGRARRPLSPRSLPCPAEPWLQSFGRSARDNGDLRLGSGVAGRECRLGRGWPVSLEASRSLGLWRSGWSLDPGAGAHVPSGLPVCPLTSQDRWNIGHTSQPPNPQFWLTWLLVWGKERGCLPSTLPLC